MNRGHQDEGTVGKEICLHSKKKYPIVSAAATVMYKSFAVGLAENVLEEIHCWSSGVCYQKAEHDLGYCLGEKTVLVGIRFLSLNPLAVWHYQRLKYRYPCFRLVHREKDILFFVREVNG